MHISTFNEGYRAVRIDFSGLSSRESRERAWARVAELRSPRVYKEDGLAVYYHPSYGFPINWRFIF